MIDAMWKYKKIFLIRSWPVFLILIIFVFFVLNDISLL